MVSDAGALGDHRRFADLQRARDLAAEVIDRFAFVKDGLAVGADQLDGIERHAALGDCFGEEFAEQEIQARDRVV